MLAPIDGSEGISSTSEADGVGRWENQDRQPNSKVYKLYLVPRERKKLGLWGPGVAGELALLPNVKYEDSKLLCIITLQESNKPQDPDNFRFQKLF